MKIGSLLRQHSLKSRLTSIAATRSRGTASIGLPIVALTYRAAVDQPERFASSKSVGASFGLTPRRYQSGETDRVGAISRAGDASVRVALFEGAHVMGTRLAKWGPCLSDFVSEFLTNVAFWLQRKTLTLIIMEASHGDAVHFWSRVMGRPPVSANALNAALELFQKRDGSTAIRGIRTPDLNNNGYELVVVSDNEYYSVKQDDIVEDEGLCGHTSLIWIKADAEVWRCQKTTIKNKEEAASKTRGQEASVAGRASEASAVIPRGAFNLGFTPPSTHTMDLRFTPTLLATATVGRKPSYSVLRGIIFNHLNAGADDNWLLGFDKQDDQGNRIRGCGYSDGNQLLGTCSNINDELVEKGYQPETTITIGQLNALVTDKKVKDFVTTFAKALHVL
jgi:hypothetical protein